MRKRIWIGMDLGDRNHDVCILGDDNRVLGRDRVRNDPAAILEYFRPWRHAAAVGIEAGTHSGWITRQLETEGLKVVVAQPRAVKALWGRARKNDESDAELLARLVRVDPSLLHPIRHRSQRAQEDLAVVRSRDALVRGRTALINTARGLAKSLGHRFPRSDARSFARKAKALLPEALVPALQPVVEVIDVLNGQIRGLEKHIEQLAQQRYPHTERLRAVGGVGAITALAYVLTVEDPTRFRRSREVGPYLGLVPRQDQSGQMDKQLHITKQGDELMRRLLVGSAQYILGPYGPPCGLRTFGERMMLRGGKNAKRRAVVAVARKLAVLLHKLWVGAEAYDPGRGVPGLGSAPIEARR